MHNNNRAMLLLLSLLSAFPPLSTDMYLPAMPQLQQFWQVPMTTINLTLVGFFVGYCVSLLLYGPLSDKYGRRPPLLVGISIYVFASLLSGLTDHVGVLIVLRVLQGMGAASGSVIAMAITKDLYQGLARQRILAYMGIIMALAPMMAPVLGSWILIWFSWHVVFFVQATIGLIALGGVLRMPESLTSPEEGSLLTALAMYLHLFANKRYIVLILLFSCIVLPHFSFIGGASHIYISRFGTSEQVFGLLFAFNALAIMAGSFTCARIQKYIRARPLLTVSFAGIFVSGLIMDWGVIPGPWGLAAPMALASFSFGLSRPPSNNIVLEQVDHGVGAASSLMVFVYFMVGAFSMWFISLHWTNPIHVIGTLAICSGSAVLALWTLLPSLSSPHREPTSPDQ